METKRNFLKTIKKSIFLSLVLSSWLALKSYGQTAKQIRDAKLKPLSDTAYVYIEGRYKNKDDKTLVCIWQQDLQTGERWYTLCPKDWKTLPKTGEIIKMPRSKMQFISPKQD